MVTIELVYSTAEAAKLLKISKRAVLNLVDLPRRKLGKGKQVIYASDLAHFIATRPLAERPAAPPPRPVTSQDREQNPTGSPRTAPTGPAGSGVAPRAPKPASDEKSPSRLPPRRPVTGSPAQVPVARRPLRLPEGK